MGFFSKPEDGAACERPPKTSDELPAPAVDTPLAPEGSPPQTLVLAAGCFWCVEAVFDQLQGVLDVASGYAGGSRESANYEAVCSGRTAHAEVVQVTYDPSRITIGHLLRVFFATHDPTTKDRQGPDSGRQYRSAIFVQNDEQRKVAEAYIAQLNEALAFARPVVTTIEPLDAGFFPAEAYHQNFVENNPAHPYVVHQALPKVEKVRKKFEAGVK